jgi:hypothetical protein
MGTRLATILLTLAITASVPLAHAEPTVADMEDARALFRQGNELRDKNDLRSALEKYKAAHALFPTPITGLEVGRTHLALGELVAARDAFVAVGKLPVKPKESSNTTFARSEAERLSTETEARIPKIIVIVESAEPAAIEIDGAAVQMPKQVDPGKHVVVVRAGTVVRTSELVIAERETREIRIALGQPPSASIPPAGKTVVDGQPAPPGAMVEDKGRPTWIWVGFGVAGAGVIVGTIAGAMTLHGTSELSSGCTNGACPPDQHDRLDSTHTWATVSTVSFVVAGAAAGVSLVGFFASSPSSSNAKQGSVTPTVGLGTVGLRGVF